MSERELFSTSEEDNTPLASTASTTTKRRKKQRTPRGNIFIEDQARVDDDEDDDDDSDAAEDGFEYAAEDDTGVQNKSVYRKLDLDREKGRRDENDDAEETAARLKAKYGKNATAVFRGDLEHLPQELLMPSVNDPKIWMVKCKPGAESQIVFNLCRKYFAMKDGPHPLMIMSCFSRDSLKGYVYLEAEKQAYVSEAIERMNNVYGSKLHLVPVKEMTDCLRAKKREVELVVDQWVRIKRGKYAGDLGQVLEILEAGDSAVIKLIPRIDLNGKRKLRQPPKLFNPNEVNKREITNQQGGGFSYQGDFFDKNGYVEKSIKISTIESKEVNPTLDEISKFSGGIVSGRGEELSMVSMSKVEHFQTGEKVVVLNGEMKGMEGVVHGVQGLSVTIVADKKYQLKNKIEYPSHELAKRFSSGDHVRVINGVHKDESGLVLKIALNVVTFISDTTFEPIEVFSKDLRAAIDVTLIEPSTSLYDLLDLVQLSPTELGVIIKMERDTYTLLDPYGNTIKCKPQQIKSKRDSSRAVTSDMNGKPVTQNDSVQVMDDNGSNRKPATILHVYRSFCFLKGTVNGAIFVTKASLVASQKASIGGTTNSSSSYFNGRDPLKAKTVTITFGAFKGYLGIVKDTTETHARVELHSNARTVNVEKKNLSIQGEDDRRPDYSMTPAHNGSRTPAYNGSRTPAYNGSRTPAYGSRTPAWDSASKTPIGYTTPFPNTPQPNVATPYETPYMNTPGYVEDHEVVTSEEVVWLTVDIEVLVDTDRQFQNGIYDMKKGAVRSVDGKKGIVILSTGDSITISQEYLKPVIPQKKDAFKVLFGDEKGKTGSLLSIDGHEGVVKIDGVDDILMMNLDTLAKRAS